MIIDHQIIPQQIIILRNLIWKIGYRQTKQNLHLRMMETVFYWDFSWKRSNTQYAPIILLAFPKSSAKIIPWQSKETVAGLLFFGADSSWQSLIWIVVWTQRYIRVTTSDETTTKVLLYLPMKQQQIFFGIRHTISFLSYCVQSQHSSREQHFHVSILMWNNISLEMPTKLAILHTLNLLSLITKS